MTGCLWLLCACTSETTNVAPGNGGAAGASGSGGTSATGGAAGSGGASGGGGTAGGAASGGGGAAGSGGAAGTGGAAGGGGASGGGGAAGSGGTAGGGGSGGSGGALAPTIACGNTPSCSTAGGGFCCWKSPNASCVQSGSACDGNRISCDGAEDCPGTEVCCKSTTTLGSGGSVSSTIKTVCASTCTPGGTFFKSQVCKATAECLTGACQNNTSTGLPPGYKTCQ